MSLTPIEPPAVEPVSLVLAKDHLRVKQDDEDALIDAYIRSAREHLEQTGIALITQRWQQTAPCQAESRLLRRPVQALEAVTIRDTEGTEVSIDLADVETSSDGLWTLVTFTSPIPTLVPNGVARIRDPITFTFSAGYGAAADDVPERWKQAILLIVGNWYEFREPVSAGRVPNEIQWTLDRLIGVETPPPVGV